MNELTPRQREVLLLIVQFWEKHHYSPSIRDVQEMMGVTTSSAAARIVRILAERGMITKDPNVSRSIVIDPRA